MSVPQVERSEMHIDKTINIGQILTAATMLIAALSAYFSVKGDLRSQEERIVRLENQMGDQGANQRNMAESLSDIRRDIAVIRDRMERNGNALPTGRGPEGPKSN